MGGKASKTTLSGREREVYARLPYGGTTDYTEVPHRPSTRATFHVHKKKQSQATNTRSTRAPSSSRSSKHPKSWTPVSPHSTTFTVSTADSAHHPEEDRDSSSSLEYSDKVNPPPVTNIQKPSRRMSDQPHAYGSGNPRQSVQPFTEDQRRIIEAETILGEIAKEYAAKRAAGLVPTKPVPARTLLWEELAKKSMQAGRRGQCVFGRDTDNVCGCTTYKKKRVPGQENPGGVCECCNHGAVWHKLQGGTMARSSRMTRSIIGSSMRASRLESGSYVPSEARSSAYEYDSDEDEDDEWDEDIANEMAMPTNYVPAQPMAPPPALQTEGSSRLDRLSLLSMGSSYGFPSRLSSATNSLGALLQAIQRYRDMGLDEDEIEERIRADFPPVPRKSSVAARSDISTSHVDV